MWATARRSIAHTQRGPYIPIKEAMRGVVFDVATGRLTEVHPA